MAASAVCEAGCCRQLQALILGFVLGVICVTQSRGGWPPATGLTLGPPLAHVQAEAAALSSGSAAAPTSPSTVSASPTQLAAEVATPQATNTTLSNSLTNAPVSLPALRTQALRSTTPVPTQEPSNMPFDKDQSQQMQHPPRQLENATILLLHLVSDHDKYHAGCMVESAGRAQMQRDKNMAGFRQGLPALKS
eukprot:TRINITY_DN44878_c0_g1_i2.p1 TRINITY_DN44878_c0_g1~~TRINITY_DN44878_c0_g1_i2.p1  ORF type:complete len:193 (+),score=26.00 TRINITY_DN44878_c0_g1_i2:100-678(+)